MASPETVHAQTLAGTSAASPPLTVVPDAPATGMTFGVEEEFHLVHPETLALRGNVDLAAAAMGGTAGDRVHAEIATSQLETATGICSSLAELRAELRASRAEAVAAAGRAGLDLLAASTHPFGSWRQQEMTRCARYDALVERYGVLPFQQDICGCHVHVGVPDLETAVAVMDRARPYLPVLLALTGSSPFHDGIDTGYDSYRTQWFARWPITGTPDRLGSADRFRTVVAGMVAAGSIADASNLYWDVRPSMRYPTVEFRVADVCAELDDVVLHAGLVRSLVRVLAERAAGGEPCPDPPSELLRVARWRAARHGVGGQLFDPLAGTLIDARLAVRRLFGELEEDLCGHGEWDELVGLAQQVLQRGTSATAQRRTLARTGDPRAVAAALVRATAL